jgi:hypothetical protein
MASLSLSGGVGKATGYLFRQSHPAQTPHARLKSLRNNLCAATRLGICFNNLNSGLTIIESHASTSVWQWVKQRSVAGITALKCGLRHHIPAVYQIDRSEHLSTVMCHLMICILMTGMRCESWQTFLDCFQLVDIPRKWSALWEMMLTTPPFMQQVL